MTVVSYEEHNGPAVDRIVDVYHPDTLLRVVVAATDAEEFETARKVVEEPPLTLDELRRIATLDVWDATMPKAYDDAGSGLRAVPGLQREPALTHCLATDSDVRVVSGVPGPRGRRRARQCERGDQAGT